MLNNILRRNLKDKIEEDGGVLIELHPLIKV
jgi:hypothetical protein